MLLGRVLRRLFKGRCFLEGFLEGACKGFLLRGPAAILFISRDTSSDSIAKLFRACFCGVSHNYRAIRCKMGYRTEVPV